MRKRVRVKLATDVDNDVWSCVRDILTIWGILEFTLEAQNLSDMTRESLENAHALAVDIRARLLGMESRLNQLIVE
jgi:hypothetical protein